MSEVLLKLSPHRDLQVYFERPSAIAAMSGASETGFVLSGTWRRQFDWAVVEWNRDNVFEPHFMRSLPDGDLSGLTLVYDEVRSNCIPLDSDLYPTVDWHVLRVWTDGPSGPDFYKVGLRNLATPIEGEYICPSLTMTLSGTATGSDHVGLSLLDEHYTYQVLGSDTVEDVIVALVGIINTFSTYAKATANGNTITITYHGAGFSVENSTVGANANRIGVYGYVSGSGSEEWLNTSARFSGGMSPTKWRITIPFGGLLALDDRIVPAQYIRKLRWTFAADLQAGAYDRSEYSVAVSNWSVTGQGRAYAITGMNAKRFEDAEKNWDYTGEWISSIGTFSGGTIHYSQTPGAAATLTYEVTHDHELAVGTRKASNASCVQIWIGGSLLNTVNLNLAGEDQLARLLVGELPAGQHTIELRHGGPDGTYFYLDFLEVFVRIAEIPTFPSDRAINLATDWDTDHSLAIPAERTAWLLHTLGFHGRVNHYVGALWYYELILTDHQYARATIEFTGTPVFSQAVVVTIGRDGYPSDTDLVATHLIRIGDTNETIALAFALEFNRGYTAIRAEATGSTLTVISRTVGADGNNLHISVTPTTGTFQALLSGDHFAGGNDGAWHTDLSATPRLNRACRDWSSAFLRYLGDRDLEVTCAFSMELQHGDTSASAGIAQRYPNGSAVYLNTPALQTNFSPASINFWRDVYMDMANLMAAEGMIPYLQFGEVQWWYFPLAGIGMGFYDEYTMAQFFSSYGRPMQVIESHTVDPAPYIDEAHHLASLIGDFTNTIIDYVRLSHPDCRFEVLYPTDVNDTPLNTLVNYPENDWNHNTLDCLKTESFTYTFLRNVDLGRLTIQYGTTRGFPPSQRAFLCGIGDSTTSWLREVALAKGEHMESITLFALDQYCLIGYSTPLPLIYGRASQLA